MSCEIHLKATLEGISKFIDLEKPGGNENNSQGSRNTLQNFKISVSPSGEIIVFARSSWILICGSKWDSSVTDGTKKEYSPSWHGHINCKPWEEITHVLCLPFFLQGQTSRECGEWTCIVLGFSSGCIRFYTEEMEELACSILQEEAITDIKFFCLKPLSHGKSQKQENPDVYVLYKSVICVLNGSLLSQVLKNKRSLLGKSSGSNKENEIYTTFDFKKYSFVGQEEVTDACFLGQTLSSSFNTFDHLVTASLVGGFHSKFKSSPPQTSLIITSGRKPFVGFHYTFEGGNSPVLSDVALAVASKIKNSVTATLPEWFGFGSKKSQADKAKEVAQNYAEKLNCRFGLCDLWRHGQSIIVSPSGEYSVVTDSLGRVLLIDNASGIALRLWKGYRDAQCGFYQIQEDLQKTRHSKTWIPKPQARIGLFVIIYAPKKGLIEIFSAQHGQRISSFKVTKCGRLLYIPREQIGSNVSAGGFNLVQNQVIFLSKDGIHEFLIPFHCALLEDNSKMARDLHVLRKMKMLLKMENDSGNSKVLEDIEKCARDLKTDEVRLQAVESFVTYRNTTLEAFKVVLQVFLEDVQNKNRPEQFMKLVGFCRAILNLLIFYEFLINLKDKANGIEDGSETPDFLPEVLRLPEKELEIILKFIQQIKEIEKVKKQTTTKVAFEDKKSTELGQYLSCFDFESLLGNLSKVEKQEDKKGKDAYLLSLKSADKENKVHYLGEVLFKGVFCSFSSLNQWKKHAKNCDLNPIDLALCLLSFWCNKNNLEVISREVFVFVEVLKSVCSLLDSNDVVVEYNSESPWWKRLRTFVAENPYTIRGLLAALCCRSVTIFAEQEREIECQMPCDKKETTKCTDTLESSDALVISGEWETISKDTCQWDILITQLQDVALLNAILGLTFKRQNKFLEVPFDFEYQCLTVIQLNGNGRVSELVAKWLVQFGLDPSTLVDKEDLEFQKSAGEKLGKERSVLILELDKANEARGCDENLNVALDYLALLKDRFPYSLTSSSLLGYMCWEYVAYWFKNIKELNYLEAALEYLENIPSGRIKYGISLLSWNTYLVEKYERLAKMMHRIGKVPRDKICTSEIGLRRDQILLFLQMIDGFLKIIFYADIEDKPNFGSNREAIWQNSAAPSTGDLISVALSQPVVNGDLISFQLQLSSCLLLMTGLKVHQKVFSSLFDNVELLVFTLSGNPHLNSHHQYVKLKKSRTEFLKKCITAAVQTVEVVEYISPVPVEDLPETVPTTSLKVEEYKKWLQICYDLVSVWALSVDDLRRHQICELYSSGFDRLAEEVIPSVNETNVLASQLLVLGGKRLKYLIQDSKDFYKRFTELSANLSEWLHSLDLVNFTYHGSIDDIEVLMRYSAQWLPEDQTDHKLAIAILESLCFFRNLSTSENEGDDLQQD